MQVGGRTVAAERFLYTGLTYHCISCVLLVKTLGFLCHSDRLMRLLEPGWVLGERERRQETKKGSLWGVGSDWQRIEEGCGKTVEEWHKVKHTKSEGRGGNGAERRRTCSGLILSHYKWGLPTVWVRTGGRLESVLRNSTPTVHHPMIYYLCKKGRKKIYFKCF